MRSIEKFGQRCVFGWSVWRASRTGWRLSEGAETVNDGHSISACIRDFLGCSPEIFYSCRKKHVIANLNINTSLCPMLNQRIRSWRTLWRAESSRFWNIQLSFDMGLCKIQGTTRREPISGYYRYMISKQQVINILLNSAMDNRLFKQWRYPKTFVTGVRMIRNQEKGVGGFRMKEKVIMLESLLRRGRRI